MNARVRAVETGYCLFSRQAVERHVVADRGGDDARQRLDTRQEIPVIGLRIEISIAARAR